MTQWSKTALLNSLSSRSEISHVIVDNPREADECILFPRNTTEKELQSKWILAKKGGYTHLEDIQ